MVSQDNPFNQSKPGGCDDDTLGSSSCIGVSLDHAVDDWKQEGGSLARTSLQGKFKVKTIPVHII